MKKNEALIYSAVGLAALFLILVAVNFLVATVPLRADLTEGRLFTLSDGTKKMLRGLQSPVKLRVYISQGDQAIPVQMRSFAQRVDDMVKEFKSVAGANLVVERYNPKPDSEEEDAAQLDGIDAQQLFSGESFYLGISVSQLDRKQTIPTVAPQRERLLEYDLARAIARVGIADKPTIGLMAGMPVLGTPFNPFTRQGAEPWVLASELKRDFNLKEVNATATSIDKDINVLLVIHPRDLSDATEYALDQFVMRGGKLIAFVDPMAYFDQQPSQMPGMPSQPGTSSNLPKLFKAWGLEMNPGKVIADVQYASGGGQRYTPTVLSLNRSAFDRNDIVTSQIETLLYAFGGAFESKPVDGLKKTDLVKTSKTSMFVDNIVASVSGEAAMKGFVASGTEYPLAVRIQGKFKTAFPEGRPKDDSPASKDKPKPQPTEPHLAESAADNSVIAVADVDMLNDGAAVDVQDVFGRKIVVPSNGNLAFAQSMVEQFASGDTLIGLASRTASFRPLTVVRAMEAQAQQQYFGKLKSLEDDLQKTTERLQELQKARGGAAAKGPQVLSAEQQAELENFRKRAATSRKELKEVRKELRQDAEALVFWTKVVNIALMPLLVMFAGIGVALLRRRRQAAA
ncbi:MAG: hypothetical protein EXR31_02255 [Betaproteobacteria bacterium]|nr:hypothetical protein [Betaproteobacteria bacterium]